MNTYEAIRTELESLTDLSKYAVRVNIQDFAIEETFILTFIRIQNSIRFYYASESLKYNKDLFELEDDLQEEVLMLITESMDEDIEIVVIDEVWF